MKALTAFTFVVLFSFFSKAQDYVPFPEDSAYWLKTTNIARGFGAPSGCYDGTSTYGIQKQIYFTFNDTLIEGLNYRLLKTALVSEDMIRGSESFDWELANLSEIIDESENILAYRNDSINKKVFAINLNPDEFTFPTEEEFLWYNFNIEIGDTLSNLSSFYNELFAGGEVIIDSIDSVLICDKFHKRFITYNCSEMPENPSGDTLKIIEGQGYGVGIPYEFFSLCMELSYPCETYEYEFFSKECDDFMAQPFLVTSINHQPLIVNIPIFPNPNYGYLNIELNNLEKIQITDINGKTVLTQIGESNIINTQSLSPGTYLLKAETKNNQFGWTTFVKK